MLEAVYRVHKQYDMTYEKIEACKVLPLRLISCVGKTGLLSVSRRRDRLSWTGNSIPDDYVFPFIKSPAVSDLCHRLEGLSLTFCPNRSCVEPLCAVHVEMNAMTSPKNSTCRPRRIMEEVKTPCGDQCFLDAGLTKGRWEKNDVESLRVVCEIAPDLSPCYLAVLCFKPCREVGYYIGLLFQASTVPTDVKDQNLKWKDKQPVVEFHDSDSENFISNAGCRQDASCETNDQCSCGKNASRRQRHRYRTAKYTRPWRGCRCSKTKSGQSCVTIKCSCVDAGKECDPQLCLGCGCRDEITCCRNSQIQKGSHKGLEIKKSRWGLGAFLVEPAQAGDLIVEYVGELIYEPTFDSRGEVAEHRGRSYVFKLDDALSLDASLLGNSGRHIDHAGSAGEVNCRALARRVNGEYRIGIYATHDLEAGSEILLDYGQAFFK